jgi:hypothetical protein
MTTKAPVVPELKCECGVVIQIAGRRIGDSVSCPSCKKLRVVLRSKVTGDVLPAAGAPGISDRLPEVQESLERIRLRKAGHAARDVQLYAPPAVFGVGAFGFWLTAVLQGQNLIALGYERQGRRLQVTAVTVYVALVLVFLWLIFRNGLGGTLGNAYLLGSILGGLAVAAAGCTFYGLKSVRAAFDAGARPASPLVPSLLGFLLAVAQLFAFKFVDVATGWW